MLSQDAVKEAEHVRKKFGMGSIQTRMPFDDCGNAKLAMCKRRCYREVLLFSKYLGIPEEWQGPSRRPPSSSSDLPSSHATVM